MWFDRWMLARPRMIGSVVAVLAVVLSSCATATEESPTPPSSQASTPPSPEPTANQPDSSVDGPSVFTPVIGSVVAAPIPVAGTDGKDHLVYELALTNTLAQEVTLTSLSVRSGDETLLSLVGDALAYWTRARGVPVSTPTRTLGPGQSGTVWLDVALDRPAGNQPPGTPTRLVQVIAALGNSGNSDAPHLHFHVMDGPDPLRSNGLPVVIDAYRLSNRLASEDALDPLTTGAPAELEPGFAERNVTASMPLDLDVMNYPTD